MINQSSVYWIKKDIDTGHSEQKQCKNECLLLVSFGLDVCQVILKLKSAKLNCTITLKYQGNI